MRRERIAILLASALAVGAGLAWMSVETDTLDPLITDIEPGAFYAFDVQSEQAVFKLPFEADTRYVLLVSSLGYSGKTHEVGLKADFVEAVETARSIRLPAHRIEPFRPKSLNNLPITTATSKDASFDSVQQVSVETDRSTTRDFFLHVTDGDLNDAKQYAKVAARVVAEGRQVRIYLDRQQKVAELSQGVTKEIVRLLDEEIIPEAQRKLGNFRDVDKDGKFSILITPWLNRLQGGRTSLGGFVRGSDFRDDMQSPFSNRCDMMYLNSNVQPGDHLHDLLSHEFTHAVCFSERLMVAEDGYALPDEEDWLNEAMAHLSEQGVTNVDYRISRFLDAPQQYPLIVSDYYRAGLWRNHGCRGATYLFLRWCVDQFGDGLRHRLIHNPVQGKRNLEWATGISFDELYRRWSIAMLKSGMQKPVTRNEAIQLASFVSEKPKQASGEQQANFCFDANGSYSSIDLHSRLMNWGLAGPRRQIWDIDTGTPSIQLKGTSTCYIELLSSGSPGLREIRLQGEYGSKLQVSLVKLPNDWPHIRIDAARLYHPDQNQDADKGIATKSTLQIQVRQNGSTDVRAELISCEQNVGETRQSYCFDREEIRLLSSPVAGNDGESVLTYAVSIPHSELKTGPLTVKIVTVDSQGRRAVAWTTIDDGYIVMK